jgi:hypothetical protein
MHRMDSRFRGNDAVRRYQHITLDRTHRWEAAENCGSIPGKGDLGMRISKARKSLPLLSILL